MRSQERLFGVCTAYMEVKVPGLKGSWSEIKAWYHVAAESLKRARERLLMTVLLSCTRDPGSLKKPGPQKDHQGQPHYGVELA